MGGTEKSMRNSSDGESSRIFHTLQQFHHGHTLCENREEPDRSMDTVLWHN